LHRFCLIHPCDRQTDGRTDGQTDRELRWLRRAIAVPAVARKNVVLSQRQLVTTQLCLCTDAHFIADSTTGKP